MQAIKRKLPTLSALVFGTEKNAIKALKDAVKDTDLKVHVLSDDLVQVVHSKTHQSVTLTQGSVLVVEGTKMTAMTQDAFDAEYEITSSTKAAKPATRAAKPVAKPVDKEDSGKSPVEPTVNDTDVAAP